MSSNVVSSTKAQSVSQTSLTHNITSTTNQSKMEGNDETHVQQKKPSQQIDIENNLAELSKSNIIHCPTLSENTHASMSLHMQQLDQQKSDNKTLIGM
jgi:hypothetical protein